MIRRLQTIAFLFVFAVILVSCGGNDDTDETPQPDNTIHELTYYDYQLGAPNMVNVVFQLSDQENIPLEMLSTAEINLKEDGAELNAAENNFMLAQSSEFDYIPYVALLIDLNSDADTALDNIKAAAADIVGSLPANSRIGLYTFSSSINTELEFTSDAAEVALAISDLQSANQGANLYGAISRAITDLSDSVSYGAGRVSPGLIIPVFSSPDTEGTSDIDEINSDIGDFKIFSFGIGTTADSALAEIEGRAGVVLNESDEISTKVDELDGLLESFEKSIYVLSYSTLKQGSDEVSVTMATLKSEENGDIDFTYVPNLFFNPDSFEIKTDDLRFVSDGSRRNGEVLLRKSSSTDSVDFQLFSGFDPSNYIILFVERDPAIFGDWASLRDDPLAIRVDIRSSDFTLDQGFQSEFIEPEVFDRKYMVIRDDNNKRDLSYIQLTLQ
jgi:hypothetical protein